MPQNVIKSNMLTGIFFLILTIYLFSNLFKKQVLHFHRYEVTRFSVLSFFSHRLSRTESLFYYNSGEMKCLPKTRSSYCQCMIINRDGKTNADCNIQFKTPKFQAKIQAGYTKILFPGI